jgi:hypothetical protein
MLRIFFDLCEMDLSPTSELSSYGGLFLTIAWIQPAIDCVSKDEV